jgi:serralysin
MPNVRETTDVTAGTTTVYTLGIGQTAQGTLATAADHDWYRVNLVAGQTYTFAMIGTGAVNDVDDTYLQLRNGAGSLLRADDDSGPDISSMLTFTATTSGTYYLDAGSYNNTDAGQYGISAALGTRAVFDEMMGAGALLVPSVSWGNTPGTAATVTWAARASFAGSMDASGYAAPFSQLTASEIASVQTAMRYYSDVGNISFTQVNPGGYSNNATILISNYTSSTDGSGAYALYPGNAAVAAAHGDMRLNTTSVNTSSQPIGS